MTPDTAKRLAYLVEEVDRLIAAAIAVGTGHIDQRSQYLELCRLNVLALAVPDAEGLAA